MKKRGLGWIGALAGLPLLCAAALAAGGCASAPKREAPPSVTLMTVYAVPEAHLEISLPEAMAVMTRSELHGEEVWQSRGIKDPAEYQDDMSQRGFYLEAVLLDPFWEAKLRMMDNTLTRKIWDAREMPEANLRQNGVNLSSTMPDRNFTGLWKAPGSGVPFIVLEGLLEGGTVSCREYVTFLNGQALFLTLQTRSPNGLSPEEIQFTENIVNALRFTEFAKRPK